MTSFAPARNLSVVTPRSSTLVNQQAVEWSLFVLMAAITLTNLANLTPDKDSTGLDRFVLVKLLLTGACGLFGLYGFFAIPRVQHLAFSLPGVWLTGVAAMYLAAALFSSTPLVSVASAISLFCVVLFTVTAVVMLGAERCVRAVLTGMTFFLAASWLAWLAVPSLGVFAEPLADGQFKVRMSGITHPNMLGQYAGMAAGLVLVSFNHGITRNRAVLLLVPFALGALVMSLSRTSTIALALALTVVYRERIVQFTGLRTLVFAAMMVTGGLLVLAATDSLEDVVSGRNLAFFAKSGETSEITSLTGRTEIWSYALQQVSERPLLGFGPATSKEILSDHVKYTHNLWLNILFCSGIAGLSLFVGLTIGRVVDLISRPHLVADFIIAFIFINGLAENVIFSFIPGAPTILLTIAVIWRANQFVEERERGLA